MRIGVPKETKVQEYRVGMIPANVREAKAHGHAVFVQTSLVEAILSRRRLSSLRIPPRLQ